MYRTSYTIDLFLPETFSVTDWTNDMDYYYFLYFNEESEDSVQPSHLLMTHLVRKGSV